MGIIRLNDVIALESHEDETLDKIELEERIRRVLPEKQREAIILEFEGCGRAEMAERMAAIKEQMPHLYDRLRAKCLCLALAGESRRASAGLPERS